MQRFVPARFKFKIMENNELIARFMGATAYPQPYGIEFEMYGVLPFIDDGENEQHFFEPGQMLFSSDWNWLLAVVDKIEAIEKDKQLLFEVVISGAESCVSAHESVGMPEIAFVEKTKIEAVYYTCVEFIKWWNLRNS